MTVSFIGGRSWSTLTKTVTLFLTTGKRHSIIDHVQLGLNYASSFHENNIYLFVFRVVLYQNCVLEWQSSWIYY